jgi:beta-aspartyl-peptidase (threonine type)
MRNTWSFIVHGGAKTIRPGREEANRAGVLVAAKVGQLILENGGTAIDAVVAAIRILEDDPTFNAGYGSVLNSDGEVELDAALMDGEYLDVGAVAAVRGVQNPIDLAKAMLLDKPVLLVGEGAARYAAEKAIALCDPRYHIAPDLLADETCDTVGCVAYDRMGHIAAGTSTGGLSGVRPGRVGDAPIPGCGLYAEDNLGGVAFSGDGESILRLALAGRLMAQLTTLSAGQAAAAAIDQMERVGGEAGCIVIDANGAADFAHNSDHFAVALASHDQEPRAFLKRSEYA